MSAVRAYCEVPFGGDNLRGPFATQLVQHDWRLFSREHQPEHLEVHDGGLASVLVPECWEYVFYCSQCKTVDVRRLAE